MEHLRPPFLGKDYSLSVACRRLLSACPGGPGPLGSGPLQFLEGGDNMQGINGITE